MSTEHLYDINGFTTADIQFSLLSYLMCYIEKPIKSPMDIKSHLCCRAKTPCTMNHWNQRGKKHGRCRVSLSIKCVLAYMCGLISSWAGLARLGSRQLSSKPSGEVNYLLYLKSAENSTLQSRTQYGVCEGLIVLRCVYLCIHMCVCVL